MSNSTFTPNEATATAEPLTLRQQINAKRAALDALAGDGTANQLLSGENAALTMRQQLDLLSGAVAQAEGNARRAAATASQIGGAATATPQASPAAPAADDSEGARAYAEYRAAMEAGRGLEATQIWDRHEAAILAYSKGLDEAFRAYSKRLDGTTTAAPEPSAAPAPRKPSSEGARAYETYQKLMRDPAKCAAASRFWKENEAAIQRYSDELEDSAKAERAAARDAQLNENGYGSYPRD